MFCPKCGKEVVDDAVVCVHCGRAIKEEPAAEPKVVNKEHNEPKTGIGVLLGIFLGLIGLIIGIVMYPEGTVARKTFIKGWLIAFLVSLGISIVMYIIIFAVYGAALGVAIGS